MYSKNTENHFGCQVRWSAKLKTVNSKQLAQAHVATGAMTFGDINDKESEIAHLKENDRMYHLLESVGTKPNVMYQTKVRNT